MAYCIHALPTTQVWFPTTRFVVDFLSLVADLQRNSLNAKVCVHRVRQPPAQNLARGPIHDRDKVQEAVLRRHKSDICSRDLVGAVDLHFR